MKNMVESKNLSLRIPSDLADEIDQIIFDTEEYTNRPDFITSAIRFTDEWIFRIRADQIDNAKLEKREFRIPIHATDPEREKERIRKINEEESKKMSWTMNENYRPEISLAVKMIWDQYNRYVGEPELILVRVPHGFTGVDYSFFDDTVGTLQDFTRFSIVCYILFLRGRRSMEKLLMWTEGNATTDWVTQEEMNNAKANKEQFFGFFKMLFD